MKKKILAYALILVLALGAVYMLTACSCKDGDNGTKEPKLPKGIKGITTGENDAGGVKFTVYRVGMTSDIDWNSMSKDEKRKIIDYVFDYVLKKNAENNIKYFNILGVHESGDVWFAFDREKDEMVTYKAGQPEYRFPVPAK